MPDSFGIVFEVDPLSLRTFAAVESRIVIAKHGGDGNGNVAWLSWAPSGSDTVTWNETYGLYAAEAGLRDGQALQMSCVLESAQDRSIYPFSESAFGEREPSEDVPAHHYDVRNDSASPMTFGLLQSAAINGVAHRSALNAVVVPPTFTADFAALTSLSVWVQSDTPSASMVRIPPTAIVLSFDDKGGTVNCRYDARTAAFVSSTQHRF